MICIRIYIHKFICDVIWNRSLTHIMHFFFEHLTLWKLPWNPGLRWSLGEAIFEAWISWPHFKHRGARGRGDGKEPGSYQIWICLIIGVVQDRWKWVILYVCVCDICIIIHIWCDVSMFRRWLYSMMYTFVRCGRGSQHHEQMNGLEVLGFRYIGYIGA